MAAHDRLTARIEAFGKARILVVGDVMLDQFVYGSVDRISPEAPIPVFAIHSETSMLGGAGNVVRNIRSLGGSATFLSVIGDDKVGNMLTRMIGDLSRVQPYLLVEKDRLSTTKTRYIAANQQIMRADAETKQPIKPNSEAQLLSIAQSELAAHDVLVLSDYGKGVLTPTLIEGLIAAAKDAGKPVFVDPKSRDFDLYRSATLVSPNLQELSVASGEDLPDEQAVARAATALLKRHRLDYLLVTRSKDGMSLFSAHGEPEHISARARDIYDVSGAGDTAIATLAVAFASGCDIATAARLANLSAGVAVGKVGTAVVYRTDLKTALYTQDAISTHSKIMPADVASDQAKVWRREGKTVGFTNGCFDLVHAGHLALLQEAKTHCDRLIVGINSDESVKCLKGESRPIHGEMERALLLAALGMVDGVVIFREDTPEKLIRKFKPDVLVKGADYTKEQVVGGAFVESYGGKIVLAALKDGYSTTNVIARIG